MIVPYSELPDGAGGHPRPLLDLAVGAMDDALLPCLVDSGALNTLLPRWVADAAGIDLEDTPKSELIVAAAPTAASFVTVSLAVDEYVWEAEVGFCDPWPYAWGLLGQLSFFRYFVVTFRAFDLEFEATPLRA